MNMGLITSLIVGGLLLIAMFAINGRLNENSGMKTLQLVSKNKVETITEYITHDFRKAGVGITSGVKVVQATNLRFQFRMTNLTGANQNIRWEWKTSEPINSTINPRDFRLYRIANSDTTDFGTGIVNFRMTYFNAAGDTTLITTDVRQIRVRLIVESDSPYNQEYARSYWETDITPRALMY